MGYTITNYASGDTIATSIATVADAVLTAARYDGWGAEYKRGADGRMALRTSKRHTGNNPWSATGEERPAYGVTSTQEDDEAAIEEVAEGIMGAEFGGNMKRLEIKPTSEHICDLLRVALEVYEGEAGPGFWHQPSAGQKEDTALLCYEWPEIAEDHPDWGNCDAPWKKWGGDEICKVAGVKIIDGYMIDGIDHVVVVLA